METPIALRDHLMVRMLGAIRRRAIPVITAQGGQVVSRGIPQETVVGGDEGRPDLVAVIRFPTAEALRRFLSSPEYRANLPHSDKAFAEVHSYNAADLMA